MAADMFKKGSIEMLSLLILQEGDIHGYQLTQLIKERSDGKLTVQEGSLYPLLYRMTDDGFISGSDVTVETKYGRKRSRVVYHLEQKGRERLLELKREYDQIQDGIRQVFQNSAVIGYEKDSAGERDTGLSAGGVESGAVLSQA